MSAPRLYPGPGNHGLSKAFLSALTVIVILAAAIVLLWNGFGQKNMHEQTVASIQNSVSSRARLCYALEGAYPSDLSYLEEHYGLAIDHDDYIVSYEAIGSNVAPDIRVLER